MVLTINEVDDLYNTFPMIDDPYYKEKVVMERDIDNESVTFKITTPDGKIYKVESNPWSGNDIWILL